VIHRIRPRPAATIVAAGLVMGLVLGGCTSPPTGAACEQPLAGVRAGACPLPVDDRPPAPDDSFPVLGQDTELSLSGFAGDVVVVNFWASWCGPCRSEQPALNRVAEEYADEPVSFVGVNVQDTSETNALLHQRDFAIPYPSITDPTTLVASRFRGVAPSTLPSTVFIDRQGRVALSLFGETDDIEVAQLLDVLLAE